MEISGIIIQKLAKQTGNSANGQWQKQEFVITTEDQYPKSVCISAFNQKVEALDNFQIGQKVKVHFNLSSREYNGKWYTEVQLWKIEAESGYQAPATTQNAQTPNNNATQPTAQNSNEAGDGKDDLPF